MPADAALWRNQPEPEPEETRGNVVSIAEFVAKHQEHVKGGEI